MPHQRCSAHHNASQAAQTSAIATSVMPKASAKSRAVAGSLELRGSVCQATRRKRYRSVDASPATRFTDARGVRRSKHHHPDMVRRRPASVRLHRLVAHHRDVEDAGV
jgi:hypothetical protein